jgi:hypothetical protein
MGNFSSDNWTGFVTPATSVSTSGAFKYIQSTSGVMGKMLANTTGSWRDEEITTYLDFGGVLFLRMSGGSGLYASFNEGGNGLVIGPMIGFDPTDPQNSGTRYFTYRQSDPAACITNWPTTGGHTFTFGARGFNVYLKIDGVLAVDTCQTSSPYNPTGTISYMEYRQEAMSYGTMGVWADPRGAGARDIAATYFDLTPLYSNYSAGILDPRDFGLRPSVVGVGSITGGTATLNLNSAKDFRVGDQVIVEVGGESPAGYNTIGVGGVSPVLHYANATARDADHSQANNTFAYLDTDGSVWSYSTTTGLWTVAGAPSGGYYVNAKTALPLVARVLAVNASPATQLTLNTNATVTATNANVYLDALPSFYPFIAWPTIYFNPAGATDQLRSYPGMTLPVPAGTFYMSDAAVAIGFGDRPNFTFYGAGMGQTIFQSPKGVPSRLVAGPGETNATVRDFDYIGNLADVGYGFVTVGANKQYSGDPPVAVIVGNGLSSNALTQRISCLNDFRGCSSNAGINAKILNVTATVTVPQREYLQWQLQLSNCTGGQIANSSVTGIYLIKAFELFACTHASVNNVTGTNAIFSNNSSGNWTFDNISTTITANSYLNQGSGALDEPIVNINNNAFGTGSVGTINNPRIIQQDYVDASNNSLKAIQIQPAQTDVTIQGQFPGGAGCSTTLGGFIQAPNYTRSSAEYGSMIMSDAARTIVSGIRIKGTAIGAPGHSRHYGNISLRGASSQVPNNVVDVIQPGPTVSGNQTNATYGGC